MTSEGEEFIPVEAAPVLVPGNDDWTARVSEGLRQLQSLRVFGNISLNELDFTALQDFFGNTTGLASRGRDDSNNHAK